MDWDWIDMIWQGTRRSSPRFLPQPWVEAAMGYDELWFLGSSVIEQNWSHSLIAEPHLGVVFHIFTADQLPIPRVALHAAAAKTIRVDIHVKGLTNDHYKLSDSDGGCEKCRSEWSDLKSKHVVLPLMRGFNPWCVRNQQGTSSSSLNDLTQLFIRGCALEHVCAMENASRQQVLRIVIQNDPDRDMPASDLSITKALRTTNLNICKILKAGMGQTGAKSIDGTKAFWRPIYLVDHRFRYCEDY